MYRISVSAQVNDERPEIVLDNSASFDMVKIVAEVVYHGFQVNFPQCAHTCGVVVFFVDENGVTGQVAHTIGFNDQA